MLYIVESFSVGGVKRVCVYVCGSGVFDNEEGYTFGFLRFESFMSLLVPIFTLTNSTVSWRHEGLSSNNEKSKDNDGAEHGGWSIFTKR
jgi:hypothetical protein